MDKLKSKRKKIKNKKLKFGIALIVIFSLIALNLIFNIFSPIRNVLLGSIGLLSFVLCACFIAIGVLNILDKSIKVKPTMVIVLCVWTILFITLLQVFTSPSVNDGFGEYIRMCYASKFTAGGAMFGVLAYPFIDIMQVTGATIVLTSILLLLGVFIVDRFFIRRDVQVEEHVESIVSDDEPELKEDDMLDDAEDIEPYDSAKKSDSDEDYIIKDEDVDSEIEKDSAIKILGLNKSDEVKGVDIVQNKTVGDKPPMFVHDEEEPNKEKIVIDDSVSKKKVLSDRDKQNKEYLKSIAGDFNVSRKRGIDNLKFDDKPIDYEKISRGDAHKTLFENNNNLYDENLTKRDYMNKKDDIANKIASIDEASHDMSAQSRLFNNHNDYFNNSRNSENQNNNFASNNNYTNNLNNNNANNNQNTQTSGYFANSNNPNQNIEHQNNSNISNINSSYASNSFNKNTSSADDSYQTVELNLNKNTTQKNWVDKNVLFDGKENVNRVDSVVVGEQTKIDLNAIPKKPEQPKPRKKYVYTRPDLSVLKDYPVPDDIMTKAQIEERSHALEEVLNSFKIPAKVESYTIGPTFTRFEMKMPLGIPVLKVTKFERDITMILRTEGGIRMQIPIPGKNAFGVEIANSTRTIVGLKDILQSYNFEKSKSPLTFALGKDINGECVVTNIEKTLHSLVAGQSGSGKSICLNVLLLSMMYKSSPEDVRFVLIDPKCVEFTRYNHLPHMLVPNVITDPEKAVKALHWACIEMDRRFNKMSQVGARDVGEFNRTPEVMSGLQEKLPFIVIVVDELSDLLSQRKKEVEDEIRRLTAKSRAAGIFLILSTQRPSSDVVTGVIKANLGTRIAFSVASRTDSGVILDATGAETLLGKGDMLLLLNGSSELKRIQGALVTSEEIDAFINEIKEKNECIYDESIEQEMFADNDPGANFDVNKSEEAFDPLMKDALRAVIKRGTASASMLQSYLGIGYPKANRLVNQMVSAGFISEPDNKNKRVIFITEQEFEERFGEDFE